MFICYLNFIKFQYMSMLSQSESSDHKIYNYDQKKKIVYKIEKISKKKDYFKLKNIDIINIKLRYYFSSQFLYHILITIPPILIYCLVK